MGFSPQASRALQGSGCILPHDPIAATSQAVLLHRGEVRPQFSSSGCPPSGKKHWRQLSKQLVWVRGHPDPTKDRSIRSIRGFREKAVFGSSCQED